MAIQLSLYLFVLQGVSKVADSMDIEETASNKRGGIPPEEREGKRLRPTEVIELPSQLSANVLECKKFLCWCM